MRTSICLNMIVKDESHVIRRCLESVKPFIDSWVIVDTGSSDGTQEIIQEVMKGVPGKLFERPWTDDYGKNRTEAIELAKHWFLLEGPNPSGYLLFMDADDELVLDTNFSGVSLSADAYEITFKLNTLVYPRIALVGCSGPWFYKGVRHEVIQCEKEYTKGEALPGIHIIARTEGNRSKDPEKYKKDALVIERALKEDPNNTRYMFYLAQSYKDARMYGESLVTYHERVKMGGWDQEVWYSKLQIAILSDLLKKDDVEIEHAYLDAYKFRPSRPETLGQLARWYRLKGAYEYAYKYAKLGVELPPASDVLFVDSSYQGWRLLDEYSIACYWTRKYSESKRVCLQLLGEGKLPDSEKTRVTTNLKFSLDILQDDKIENLLKVKTKLNLGCGRFPDPDAINVDLVQLPGVDIVTDLEKAELPLPDNSIELFTMSHVLEHIKNTLGLMQELWRVAKPDALLTIRIPHGASDDAWEDPTHVRPYFFQSFNYFSQPYYWRADYGYRGDWQPEELTYVVQSSKVGADLHKRIETDRNVVNEMIVVLRAVKPIRKPERSLQYLPKLRVQKI